MKCMNCGNELTGKKRAHCSDRCRMALKRKAEQKAKAEHEQTQPEQPKPNELNPLAECFHPIDLTPAVLDEIRPDQPGGLERYYATPNMYAERKHAELLNWGKWMDTADLELHKLKANRVSIPGDWDYAGVAA